MQKFGSGGGKRATKMSTSFETLDGKQIWTKSLILTERRSSTTMASHPQGKLTCRTMTWKMCWDWYIFEEQRSHDDDIGVVYPFLLKVVGAKQYDCTSIRVRDLAIWWRCPDSGQTICRGEMSAWTQALRVHNSTSYETCMHCQGKEIRLLGGASCRMPSFDKAYDIVTSKEE